MRSPRTLLRISPDDPYDCFPDPESALREPDGLLAVGGDLAPARLLAAYRRGIFPWYSQDQPILWWCPDPRAVLLPQELHVSRSLRRTVRSNRYQVSVNQDFPAVIRGCAHRGDATATWLTQGMIEAYEELHRIGHACSVETWQTGKLAGGLYGVFLNGIFFGESMFSLQPDASKVALVKLVHIARRSEIPMIDCQVANEHLLGLGARLIPRREFLDRIAASRGNPSPDGIAAELATDTSGLLKS